jgi:hypothetical protein
MLGRGDDEVTKMPHTNDYRKRAEECVQLAQIVRTAEQRTMLLHIAETWLRLADAKRYEFGDEPGMDEPEPARGSMQ